MRMYISCEPKSKKLYSLLIIISAAAIPLKLRDCFEIFPFNELKNIEKYLQNISKMIVILPYIFAKYYGNKKIYNMNKIKELSSNVSIKDYIILVLIVLTKFSYNLIEINNKLKFDSYSYDFFNSVNILIFILLLMKFISNYKFYNHNILSLTLIAFSVFIVQIIIIKNKIFLVLFIFSSFLNSISISYEQNLIINKNISLYKVCFFYGLINFILYIVKDIISIKCGLYFTYKGQLIDIEKFYKEIIFCNFFIIFIKSLYYIFFYIIIFYSYYLIIYNFSIILTIIMTVIWFSFGDLIDNISYYSNSKLLINGLLFIFVIINYLVYIEIIEISFCKLNKYTRRNILRREEKEKKDLDEFEEKTEDDIENKILELSRGYFTDIRDIPEENSRL